MVNESTKTLYFSLFSGGKTRICICPVPKNSGLRIDLNHSIMGKNILFLEVSSNDEKSADGLGGMGRP